MSRKFEGKLSKADVAWLQARYPEPYVDNMIAVHGVKQGADDAEAQAKAADAARAAAEKAALEAQEAAEAAEAARVAAEAESATSASQEAAEDLLGEPVGPTVGGELYDPLAHTTNEVRAYLKGASEDEVARVKAVEQAREDREPRTSITGA